MPEKSLAARALKFGKRPAKIDERTIGLKMILKAIPPPPDKYAVDETLDKTIPLSMLGNDKYGDCVIVGKANHLLRLEEYEQDEVISVTEQDCLNQYWKEEGWRPCSWGWEWWDKFFPKPDRGLVMLDSLNAWRKEGWSVAGRNYTIHAFAALQDITDLKNAVYYFNGAEIGFSVPQSAIDQFDAGEKWEVVSDYQPIVGGHAIYISAYSPEGVECITWAKKQWMSWEFYQKYADESWGIVDERDLWKPDSPVDAEKLERILEEITA
jgi:hypothetical protein